MLKVTSNDSAQQEEGKRGDRSGGQYNQLGDALLAPAHVEPGAPPMWNPDWAKEITYVNTIKYIKDESFSYRNLFQKLGTLALITGCVSVLDSENQKKIMPFLMICAVFSAWNYISDFAYLDSLRTANLTKEAIMEYPKTHENNKANSQSLRNSRHRYHLGGLAFNALALAGFVYTGIEFASGDSTPQKLGVLFGTGMLTFFAALCNTQEASKQAERVYGGTVVPSRVNASTTLLMMASIVPIVVCALKYGPESTEFAASVAVPFMLFQNDAIHQIENIFTKSVRTVVKNKDGTDLQKEGVSIGSSRPFTCFPRAKIPLATMCSALTAITQASFTAIGYAGKTQGPITAGLLTAALGLMWLNVRGQFKENMVNLPKDALEAHKIDINNPEKDDIEAGQAARQNI